MSADRMTINCPDLTEAGATARVFPLVIFGPDGKRVAAVEMVGTTLIAHGEMDDKARAILVEYAKTCIPLSVQMERDALRASRDKLALLLRRSATKWDHGTDQELADEVEAALAEVGREGGLASGELLDSERSTGDKS